MLTGNETKVQDMKGVAESKSFVVVGAECFSVLVKSGDWYLSLWVIEVAWLLTVTEFMYNVTL